MWGALATSAGHEVTHFSFDGARTHVPPEAVCILSEELLVLADTAVAKANATLKRRWPILNPYTANLLRRNYYQVFQSDMVYAISKFENRQVAGGTAWAVQMFIDMKSNGSPLPCYVFDQEQAMWAQWDGIGYAEMDDPPPRPQGIWAGIGTRHLNAQGIAAAQTLFD